MEDIFESKVKLLQTIIKWSIKHGVLFVPVKTNKTCYTSVYTFITKGDNIDRDVCLWFPRRQMDTSKLDIM